MPNPKEGNNGGCTMSKQTALTPVSDAQSALAEMTETGQLDKYLYSYKQGNKEITDLNTAGVNSLAIAQGVSIDSVIILEENDTQSTVQAVAINHAGLKHHGIAREFKKGSNGYPNTHALTNATSKAQRNAKKGLLPMAEVREAIRKAGKTPGD